MIGWGDVKLLPSLAAALAWAGVSALAQGLVLWIVLLLATTAVWRVARFDTVRHRALRPGVGPRHARCAAGRDLRPDPPPCAATRPHSCRARPGTRDRARWRRRRALRIRTGHRSRRAAGLGAARRTARADPRRRTDPGSPCPGPGPRPAAAAPPPGPDPGAGPATPPPRPGRPGPATPAAAGRVCVMAHAPSSATGWVNTCRRTASAMP